MKSQISSKPSGPIILHNVCIYGFGLGVIIPSRVANFPAICVRSIRCVCVCTPAQRCMSDVMICRLVRTNRVLHARAGAYTIFDQLTSRNVICAPKVINNCVCVCGLFNAQKLMKSRVSLVCRCDERQRTIIACYENNSDFHYVCANVARMRRQALNICWKICHI